MKTHTFQRAFTRVSFAGLFFAAGVSSALAQTNGTLTGTTNAYTYSTAPWVITGGTGTYPDGGGTATFNPVTGVTPGTVGSTAPVTFDVSPTLSNIVFNTPTSYNLSAASGQAIVAANTGLTINTQYTVQSLFINGYSSGVNLGSIISAPISGGGTSGLTRTGPGTVALNQAVANTYTGGTHFNGGVTYVGGTAAVGDGVLGATGAGNGLSFNGGSALFSTGGGLTTARDIFIDTGGATFLANTATTLNGVISGPGTLTSYGYNSSLTLQGVNTYTGATIARYSSPITTLSGTGSILASSSYDLMGTFNLTNTGTNVTNRLSDTAAVTLRGLNFVSTGNATANSSETIGAVTAANGVNTFLVTPGASAGNSLTMASLTRQNNSTVIFRGTGLGGTPGAGVSNTYVTAAPTLVGGGGGAGTTGISIIPYAIGNNTNSVLFTAAGLVGSSFVTNDVNGIRPLATNEYATAFGVNNTDNVIVTAVTAAPAATVNSLLIAPAAASAPPAAPILTGGTINVTSGAVLYSPTANVTGFIGANLNFGAAEGVVTNTSLATFSGVLSGSGGLTLSSAYPSTSTSTPTLSLTGANTYTGTTTVTGGVIGYSGTVASGTAGAFGTSGTIVLNAGSSVATLASTAATTFNRDISVIGYGQNYLAQAASNFTTTFNGNISLSNSLNVYGYSNAATSAMTFNGTISGTGNIRDQGATYGVFNGNNTYSGGTLISSSSYFAGTDTAFGTGTISFTGGTLSGVGTTPRTIANPLFFNAAFLNFGGTAPLTFTGGVTLNGNSTITSNNTALTTFTGTISNGAFTKSGLGAVAFNSTTGNAFAGGFINTGTATTASAIYANNTSGSAFGTGAVSIGANSATSYSTLAGSFTTSGATSIAGRLSPGNTPTALTPGTAGIGAIGTAAFNGNLTLSSATTSSLYLEAASNVSHDEITVGGALTLNGTVFIATTGGFSFSKSTVIDFADWSSITVGTVAFDTTNAAVDPGYALDTSFFTTDGTIRVMAVPEPTTLALFGVAGALGLAGYARRRRAA